MEPKIIDANRIIWERNFQKEVCVNIPPLGKKCITLTAGVKLLEDNNKYYIELQLMGSRARYEIGNVCYPVYSIGIARLTVCTSDIQNTGGKLSGINITVKICVDGNIGPIHIGQCWDLLNQSIKFLHLEAGTKGTNGEIVVEGYNDVIYFEN